METKTEKVKALAYEATLVSLIIEDVCLENFNGRVVKILQLWSEKNGKWKGVTLKKIQSKPGVYKARFYEEAGFLLEDFMTFSEELVPEDLTAEFIPEASQMLTAVGNLAKYIRDDSLETNFVKAALQWLLVCQKAQGRVSNALIIRIIGALQANGLAPMIVFRESENPEDAVYQKIANHCINNSGLPN